MGVIDRLTNTDNMSPSQQAIVSLLRQGLTRRDVADELGISVGTVQNHLYRALRRDRLGPTSKSRDHFIDPLDEETPREARARVARDLAEGRRCTHKMMSGAPCSLLLPCVGHAR